MVGKLFCSMLVMALSVGLLAADEIRAMVTKVDGDKVTFQKYKSKGGSPKVDRGEKDGPPVTLPVTKDAKILKSTYITFGKKEKPMEPEPVEGGLKNEMFKKIPEIGIFAVIVTSEDNKAITKVTFYGKGKDEKDPPKDK